MPQPYKVLFVCMGNICRSPAGECIFRSFVEEAGLEESIEIDSAGTIGFHEGNPPDSRMKATGKRRGYSIVGAARQIKPADFAAFDLIVTMDNENYHNVMRIKPSGETRATVKPFCEFCTEHSEEEVPDPYYGGAAGFEHVIDLLEDGCRSILAHAQNSK